MQALLLNGADDLFERVMGVVSDALERAGLLDSKPIDLEPLQRWVRAGASEATEKDAPGILLGWLRGVRKKRLKLQNHFLLWREKSVFKPISREIAKSFKDREGRKPDLEAVVTEAVLRGLTSEAPSPERSYGQPALDKVLSRVPAPHRTDFVMFLGWMMSRQTGVAAVEADALLCAYLMLIHGASLINPKTLLNATTAAFLTGASLPVSMLVSMGISVVNASMSERVVDEQIRVLEGFIASRPLENPVQAFDAHAGGDGGRADRLRAMTTYLAHRVNDALTQVQTRALATEIEAIHLSDHRPFLLLEKPDGLWMTSRSPQPLLVALKYYEFFKLEMREVYRAHREDLGVVAAATVGVLTAMAALAQAEALAAPGAAAADPAAAAAAAVEAVETEHGDAFRWATGWLSGNLGDVPAIRELYVEMLRNPFVDYGEEHDSGVPRPGSEGLVPPVAYGGLFGGALAELVDRLRELSLKADKARGDDPTEKAVLATGRAMLEDSSLDASFGPAISQALTVTLSPDMVWQLLRGALGLRFKRGAILRINVDHLFKLATEKAKLKDVALGYEKADLGGTRQAVEYTLAGDDGKPNYDAEHVSRDEGDGEPYLVVRDPESKLSIRATDETGAVLNGAIELDRDESMVSEAKAYLDAETGGAPAAASGFSIRVEEIKFLLLRRESNRLAVPMFFELMQELRNEVLAGILPSAPPVSYARLAEQPEFAVRSMDGKLREAALVDARGFALAQARGEEPVSTYPDPSRAKQARREAEQREVEIQKGLSEVRGKLEAAARPRLVRKMDEVVVGRSPACAADDTAPTEMQRLIESAVKNANAYLARQYQMFGLWALFNLLLVAVLFMLLYKIWQVLFQYYQFRREDRAAHSTPNSNNVFDPADDNDNWVPSASQTAKHRVPSGAAIESRLVRMSAEGGLDLNEAIDSSKDNYEKKEAEGADDEDGY